MSIYPVKINEWFFNKDDDSYEEMQVDREIIEDALPYLKCEVCGKPANKRGYVYHAFAYGFGEYWCSLKCLQK